MSTEYLSYDVARCNGTGANICADCLRRTVPGRPAYQAYFMPQLFADNTCPDYIAPVIAKTNHPVLPIAKCK